MPFEWGGTMKGPDPIADLRAAVESESDPTPAPAAPLGLRPIHSGGSASSGRGVAGGLLYGNLGRPGEVAEWLKARPC
ncbi:MAG: hypothetical protein CL908_26035 [Deltaproteobacteria bacterium]|nr:hypothetical protein [Deltaproteobacteria bacterium]